MLRSPEKIYKRVVVVQDEGYTRLRDAMSDLSDEVNKIEYGYNDEFLIRITIEKLNPEID